MFGAASGNYSASGTFTPGSATMHTGRYVRENNLQYLFARAEHILKGSMGNKRVTREDEERLVKEAFQKVQAEVQEKEKAIMGFRTSFTLKSGPSAVVVNFKVAPGGGGGGTAAVAYKSKAGPLNANVTLNATQWEAVVDHLKLFAPYINNPQLTSAATSSSSPQNPPLTLVLDEGAAGTHRLDTTDGAVYRILDDTIAYLREVRQEAHTKRMFVPL